MTPQEISGKVRLVRGRLAKGDIFFSDAQEAFRKKHYDSAVSRAYYATFHAIKAVLISYDRPEVERWEKHESILNACADEDRRYTWFKQLRPLRGCRDLRQSLLKLFRLRKQADYDLEPIGENAASEVLKYVRSFLRLTKEKIDAKQA